MDKDRDIYVSDSVTRRVYVFFFLMKKEKFLREIGTDHIMKRPTGIAIDQASGTLYVVVTLPAISLFLMGWTAGI